MTKRKLEPRVCAICGKGKGTTASTLHLKWLREKHPELVRYEGDYVHPTCMTRVVREAR